MTTSDRTEPGPTARVESAWSVGTSASAAEVVVGEGALRIAALFGTVETDRPTAPAARHLVEQVWLGGLQDALFSSPSEVIHGAAETADDALRRQFSPADVDGRGTVAVAVLDEGRLLAGGTAEASAFHVARARVHQRWLARDGDRDHPSGHVPRFAGGRPSDAAYLEPALFDAPWNLNRGDRVVLATRDLRVWIPEGELSRLVSQGDPESAAHTVAQAVRVRGAGIEVAVTVIEWAAPDAPAALGADEEFSDILGALEGLVDRFTDPGIAVDAFQSDEEHFDELGDEDGGATADFAPVRDRRSNEDSEAVLSLTPTEGPTEEELLGLAPEQDATPATTIGQRAAGWFTPPPPPPTLPESAASPEPTVARSDPSRTPDSLAERSVAPSRPASGQTPPPSTARTPSTASSRLPAALMGAAIFLALAAAVLGWLVWQGA